MGCRRRSPPDPGRRRSVAASQLSIASTPSLPLLPDDGAQPPPGPFIKLAQYRRCLAEAEVAAPSAQIDGQLFDDVREACPARAPGQLSDSRLEAVDRLRRDATPRLSLARKA